MDKLPGVLWAYGTIRRKPTRVSPFSLTYGMEVTILIEIRIPTLRTEVPATVNVEDISNDLDMADELQEAAVIRIASYQQRTTNFYNRHIKPRAFRAEDLVLRKVFENTTGPVAGKFQPNREGSCIVVRVGTVGLYILNKLNRTPVPRMWNAMHLKRYYH